MNALLEHPVVKARLTQQAMEACQGHSIGEETQTCKWCGATLAQIEAHRKREKEKEHG